MILSSGPGGQPAPVRDRARLGLGSPDGPPRLGRSGGLPGVYPPDQVGRGLLVHEQGEQHGEQHAPGPGTAPSRSRSGHEPGPGPAAVGGRPWLFMNSPSARQRCPLSKVGASSRGGQNGVGGRACEVPAKYPRGEMAGTTRGAPERGAPGRSGEQSAEGSGIPFVSTSTRGPRTSSSRTGSGCRLRYRSSFPSRRRTTRPWTGTRGGRRPASWEASPRGLEDIARHVHAARNSVARPAMGAPPAGAPRA